MFKRFWLVVLSDIAYKERQCNLFMQSFHLAEKHNNIIQHAKIKPKMLVSCLSITAKLISLL